MSRSKRPLTLAMTEMKVATALDGNMLTYDVRSDRRAQTDDIVTEVRVDLIDPSPWQHRLIFDEAELRSLAISFGPDGSGLLQPPTVRPKADGRYELVAGERRLRAAKLVPLVSLRVLVRDLDDRAARLAGAIENIERDSLSPYELSCAMLGAVEAYREAGGRTNAGAGSIAREWGLSRPVVSEHLAVARSITPELLLAAGGGDAGGHLDPAVVSGLSLAALKRAAQATTELSKVARLRGAIDALRRRAASRSQAGQQRGDGWIDSTPSAEGSHLSSAACPAHAVVRSSATAEQGFRKQIRKPIEFMSADDAERHLQDLVPVVVKLASRLGLPDDATRVLSEADAPLLLVACGRRSRVATEAGSAPTP